MLLSFSIWTFLTNYDVICRKLNTLHCTKRNKNEREIIQWRLLLLISPIKLRHWTRVWRTLKTNPSDTVRPRCRTRLLRCCPAKGSGTGFFQVGPKKVKAHKSVSSTKSSLVVWKKEHLLYFVVTLLLCILTSFQVLAAPESWWKHFFFAVFNLFLFILNLFKWFHT